MSIQPVTNLVRRMRGRARGQATPGNDRNDSLVVAPQLSGPGRLLAAYHLLRPSMHFMRLVHEWGLLDQMWSLFDAVRIAFIGSFL